MHQRANFCTPALTPLPSTHSLDLVSLNSGSTAAKDARLFMTHTLNRDKQDLLTSNDVQILFTLDLSGNLKSIDVVGEKILGYRRQELRCTNLSQLVAPEFVEYVRQQIARAGTDDPGAVYEIEVITRDRRRVRLEMSTRLVMRNDRPFELEGIALVRGHVAAIRPRCLDDRFTLNFGSRPYPTLTFSAAGNKP